MFYTTLKGNIYHLRVRVPASVYHLTSKRFIWKSLHTNSSQEARCMVATKYHLIRKMKRMSSRTTFPELQALWDELTDFSGADARGRLDNDDLIVQGYVAKAEEARSSLEDGGCKMEVVSKAQPFIGDYPRHRLFEELTMFLMEERAHRQVTGVSRGSSYKSAQVVMEDGRDLYAKRNPEVVVPVVAATPTPVVESAPVITVAEAVKTFVDKMELESTITKANRATRARHLEWMVNYFDISKVTNITDVSKKHVIALVAAYTRRVDTRNIKYTRWTLKQVITAAIKGKAPDGEGISSQSVKHFTNSLKVFFRSQFDDEVISINPALDITVKVTSTSYDRYSTKEMKTIEEFALKEQVPWKKWSVLIAMYTGARISEIEGLLLSEIKVCPETGTNYFWIEGGKTDAARRQVPVHSKLVEYGVLDALPLMESKARDQLDYFLKTFLGKLKIARKGVNGGARLWHGFRVAVIDTLANLTGGKINTNHLQQMVGHEKSLGITNTYMRTVPVADLVATVEELNWS